MSVIVTGGAGFIGSNLVQNLIASGKEVIVLDNLHTGSRSNLAEFGNDVTIIQASCEDILWHQDLRPEEIYHLGIPSSSPMYKSDPLLFGHAVNGSISVFELARKCAARVIYASSSSLYNGLNPPHHESMVIPVTDYYTEARLAVERIGDLYKQLFDVSSVGLRLFSVYGPKERSKEQYANIEDSDQLRL